MVKAICRRSSSPRRTSSGSPPRSTRRSSARREDAARARPLRPRRRPRRPHPAQKARARLVWPRRSRNLPARARPGLLISAWRSAMQPLRPVLGGLHEPSAEARRARVRRPAGARARPRSAPGGATPRSPRRSRAAPRRRSRPRRPSGSSALRQVVDLGRRRVASREDAEVDSDLEAGRLGFAHANASCGSALTQVVLPRRPQA